MNPPRRVRVVGSYNHDLMFRCQVLPTAGKTVTGDFGSAHGGKGFNQAMACHRLGCPTLFHAAIGEDLYADNIRDFARIEGMNCHWQSVPEPTGLAVVMTDKDAENQIVVAAGANHQLDAKCIIDEFDDTPEILLLQCEISSSALSALITRKTEYSYCILNPAPMTASFDIDWLRQVDMLTPNESEFFDLYHLYHGSPLPDDWTQADDESLKSWCNSLGVDTLIITLGASGCLLYQSERVAADQLPALKRIRATPVDDVRDTTGAGDAFNGALAAALVLSGGNLERAIQIAQRAAAHCIRFDGAAPAMPHAEDIGLQSLINGD